MDLERWVKNILMRFPTNTIPKEDEWYGVENGVDVLEIAIAVKQLQAKVEGLAGQADGYCAESIKQKAKVKRLRKALEESWGVVEELVTQCASDVATGCWPTKLGYSEKDVKCINKFCEQALKESKDGK